MTITIHDLIEKLASKNTSIDVFNQYALNDNKNNTIRRANLANYLQRMLEYSPDYMMVMEASGYRGCRLTGIPVTSRKILLEGIPQLNLFGKEQNFKDTDDPGFENVYGEQSATIVWQTLAEVGTKPLIWNAYPFHPHKTGQLRTNRKPRKSETETGLMFLRHILDIFQNKVIIAVGNVAYDSLSSNNIICQKVRHPAQGGKNDFVQGIKSILQNQSLS